MSALCNDCGMDTEPWPPHRGTQEHYIVKNEVWSAAGMPPGELDTDDLSIRGGGILCVGCIEKRLGRLLTIEDFSPLTLTPDLLKGCQNTPRLLSRIGVAFMAVANNSLPEHLVERWAATTLTNALAGSPLGRGLVQVDVNGDEVILIFKRGKKSEAVRYRAGPEIKALMAALRRDQIPEGDGQICLLAWEGEAA
jgi:hypothetical protein